MKLLSTKLMKALFLITIASVFTMYNCTTYSQTNRNNSFKIPIDHSSRKYPEQQTNNHEATNELVDIFDPGQPIPFRIEYQPQVKLPDSLGGNLFKGNAIIRGNLNSKLEITNLELIYMHLSLIFDEHIVFKYFYQDSLSTKNDFPSKNFYPIDNLFSEIISLPKMSTYSSFLKDHIQKTKKIIKQRNLTENDKEPWYFMFRLRFNEITKDPDIKEK